MKGQFVDVNQIRRQGYFFSITFSPFSPEKLVTLQPFCRIPMAARMNNQYEERLGTERMLPLIFKMALPAVAAQFVNLLYNIVDRIYIGHIPEIGTNALAGVGVTTSIVILISSFSAIVGAGGAPLAAMALGQATGCVRGNS